MNIVITGSTKGIGFGMAESFVKKGHRVAVSSRRSDAVDAAVGQLNALGPGAAAGLAADVTRYEDLAALWQHAVDQFGSVDIWINNAGITNRKIKFDELAPKQIGGVVDINVGGLMNGCRVAVSGMLAQGSGKIFNMEGLGSDGSMQPGMSVYGATKSGLRYFTKALVKEYEDSPLVIGYMSPGIVVTDFLTKDLYGEDSNELEKRKKFLNILADRVETVAPVLVDGAIKADKTGVAIRWMTGPQALGRLVKSLFIKRDVFAET